MKKTCLKTSGNWAVNVTVLREFFIKWAHYNKYREDLAKPSYTGGVRHATTLSSVSL
jgi:hypothetical protein